MGWGAPGGLGDDKSIHWMHTRDAMEYNVTEHHKYAKHHNYDVNRVVREC